MIGKMYCPLVTLSPFRQAERVVAAPWGGRGGLRVGAYLSSAECDRAPVHLGVPIAAVGGPLREDTN